MQSIIRWSLVFILTTHVLVLRAQSDFFISGPTSVCPDLCYTYTVEPPGIPLPVAWSVTDQGGNLVNFTVLPGGTSIEVCFPEVGTFSIVAGDIARSLQIFAGEFTQTDLVIVDPVGCSQEPGTQCQQVCAGSVVTLALKDLQPTSIEWSIWGDGEIIFTDNNSITVRFSENTGTVFISYFGFIGEGCVFEGGSCVEIILPPEAGFTSVPESVNDTITICSGQSIDFLNSSLADKVQWFSGITGSGEGNTFSVSFTDPGIYTVTQRVFSACACDDSKEVIISVLDASSPPIYCLGSVCQGDTSLYQTDNGCAPYMWSIDGQGNIIGGGGGDDAFIEIVWDGGQTGVVSLSNACHPQCPVPTREEIYILGNQSSISGPINICTGQTVSYNVLPYNGSYFTWNISPGGIILNGQGTNRVSIRFTSPQSNPFIAVQIEDCTKGCNQRDTLWLNIVQPFSISGDLSLCPDRPGMWSASSAGVPIPVLWRVYNAAGQEVFSSGVATSDFTFSGSIEGVYTLVAVPENNLYCNEQQSLTFTVSRPLPVVNNVTGPAEICPDIYYTYQLESADTSSVYFKWEVIKGSTTEVYYGFSIRIRWENLSGQFLRVYPVDPSIQCEGLPFELAVELLTDISWTGDDRVCLFEEAVYELPQGAVSELSWSITPGNAGIILDQPADNQVRIKWLQSGPAEVEVKFCGLNYTETVIVLADPEPEVVLPPFICAGDSIILTTTIPFASYTWYSDGVLLGDDAIQEIGAGRYLLVVTNDDGCSGRTRFQLDSTLDPRLEIIPISALGVCAGEEISLSLSTSPDPEYSYTWFLDGVPQGTGPSLLVATGFGRYVLEAIHINTGCRFYSNELITCEYCELGSVCFQCPCNAGGAGGGGSPPCDTGNGLLVPFATPSGSICNEYELNVTNPNIINVSVRWVVFDGNTTSVLAGNPVNYTFINTGRKEVFVFGSILSGSDTLNLCPLNFSLQIDAAVQFDVDLDCTDTPVSFFNRSRFLGGVFATGFEWDFGDPASGAANMSTLENPEHIFSGPGTYDVRFEVQTSSGCSISYTRPVVIPDFPDASFVVSGPNCIDTPVIATAAQNTGFFEWYFDNISFPDQLHDNKNPGVHRYLTSGSFTIRLDYEDLKGCASSFDRVIDVRVFDGTAEITSDKIFPQCVDDWATLTATPGTYSYIWSNGEITQDILATESGDYTVTITDNFGCRERAGPIEAVYYPLPDVRIIGQIPGGAPFIEDDTLVACFGNPVVLFVFGSNVDRIFTWSNGAQGQFLRFDGVQNELLSPGLYSFTVNVLDTITGCFSTSDPYYIRVHPVPAPPSLNTFPTGVLCGGSPVDISVSNIVPNQSYIWSSGEAGTQITTEIPGIYSVTTQNLFGCSSESNPVIIQPSPDISFSPQGCFLACESLTICLPVPPGMQLISWEKDGEILPLPSDPSQIVINESGVYSGIVENASGCRADLDPITIDINTINSDISGIVFLDKDRDGNYFPPDSLLSGVWVYLISTGNIIDSIQTAPNGSYLFADIAPGSYHIVVDTSEFPDSWFIVSNSQPANVTECKDSLLVDPVLVFECNDDPLEILVSLCPGEAYELNGEFFTSDTTVTITNVVASCELTEMYILTFLDLTDTTRLQYSACIGTSITVAGQAITNDTIFISVERGANGCDSILVHEIVFDDLIEEQLFFSVCPDSFVVFRGDLFFSDTTFSSLISGGSVGCDTMFIVNIVALPERTLDIEAIPACPGQSDGNINIAIFPSQNWAVESIRINGLLKAENDLNIQNVSTGIYTISVTGVDGCLLEGSIDLPERDSLRANIEDIELACGSSGDSLRLLVSSGQGEDLNIFWEDGSSSFSLFVSSPGIYSAEVSNDCETILVSGNALPLAAIDSSMFYVPNAFTPNDDNINDDFRPYFQDGTVIISYLFEIFDRWGNKLFESENPEEGWGGYIRERKGSINVYVWKLDAVVEFCDQINTIKSYGDVTLYHK
jgi:gliding motility-associated-like protein